MPCYMERVCKNFLVWKYIWANRIATEKSVCVGGGGEGESEREREREGGRLMLEECPWG